MLYQWNNALTSCHSLINAPFNPFLLFLVVLNGPLPNINPFEMNSWKICWVQPEIAKVIMWCQVGEGEEGGFGSIFKVTHKKIIPGMQVHNFDEDNSMVTDFR